MRTSLPARWLRVALLLWLSLVLPLIGGEPTAVLAAAPVMTGLHVVGNQIVNGTGQIVRVRGTNRSGTEFACVQGWGLFEGPVDDPAIAAMAAWGINVVRLPLNEHCWLGINGVNPAYGGANYQQAVAALVARINAHGMAVILDLHWAGPGTTSANGQIPMADRDHAPTFWAQVATAYKGNSSVLFDLFNEPYPDNNVDSAEAWRCWRDGGTCAGVGYQAAGMQELLQAVRGTGATNIVLLGGVAYSAHLSQWLHYRPTDPAGNLVAAWHIYAGSQCNVQACWDAEGAPVAAQVPLIAGEFGQSDCGRTFVDQLLNWHDAHGAGYLAWTWNVWGCNGPSLISDYNGTPTTLGQALKERLGSTPQYSALLLQSTAGGTASSTPAPGTYPNGTVITLAAQPQAGQLFLGWWVDGVQRSYHATEQLVLATNQIVVANFAPQPSFTDLMTSDPALSAIQQLAARDIIKGYGDGRFGPNDQIIRAQMAVLIVRTMAWGGEQPANPFIDRNGVDAELWNAVAILANRHVALGYGNGIYGTTDPVSQAQVISFITRAMVMQGYWVHQPEPSPAIYSNIAADNAHRQDIVTYTAYVGSLPGFPAPSNSNFTTWNQPAIRSWFAQALWAALEHTYRSPIH